MISAMAIGFTLVLFVIAIVAGRIAIVQSRLADEAMAELLSDGTEESS